MSVKIIIEVTHTENGIELKPEVNTLADGHCAHEMAFSMSIMDCATRAAKHINASGVNNANHYGENKHVH